MESVVVLKLVDLDRAREALRRLQRLHDTDGFRLEAVAVVKGNGNGHVTIVEQHAGPLSQGRAAVVTMGALLGMLGAPPKAVPDGAAASIIRSVAEIADVEDSETAAASISRSPHPPRTAVLAVVAEPTPALLDRLASKCRAGLIRRARPDVDRDLAAVGGAVLAAQASPLPDRPIGDQVREVKDALKEAFGRSR